MAGRFAWVVVGLLSSAALVPGASGAASSSAVPSSWAGSEPPVAQGGEARLCEGDHCVTLRIEGRDLLACSSGGCARAALDGGTGPGATSDTCNTDLLRTQILLYGAQVCVADDNDDGIPDGASYVAVALVPVVPPFIYLLVYSAGDLSDGSGDNVPDGADLVPLDVALVSIVFVPGCQPVPCFYFVTVCVVCTSAGAHVLDRDGDGIPDAVRYYADIEDILHVTDRHADETVPLPTG